jgi:phosphopantetheinyl transferase (holo-ACP synthase)
VGIDIEFGALPLGAAHLVLSRVEQRELSGRCRASATARLQRLFCAKEAAFKALDHLLPSGVGSLRRLEAESVAGGFLVSHAGWRAPPIVVSVRPIATGHIAWCALRTKGGPM